MSDPAVNALAVQMEYGDDELKRDIELMIRRIVLEELGAATCNPTFMDQLIVNNAHAFNRQVLRAVKDQFNHPQQIY